MKFLIKSAVLALLLTSTEGIRLTKNESTDIDSDDMEIQEGPLKDESDVAVYTDSIINKGESVKKINQEVKEQKAVKAKGGPDPFQDEIDGVKLPHFEQKFLEQ